MINDFELEQKLEDLKVDVYESSFPQMLQKVIEKSRGGINIYKK